ncbi:TetR/AcrR family transcriptional regulator [Snuella lapsa]|uniref:TetR/AcrR family transcriptional regulator n=1 Tax=Snuella lapsa TaxID=870481 RepID=A0ABP6YBF7_9FLAO
MKKTKAVILDVALELFNNQGLSKVTLRTIANKMGISQGNLNYHFKKREDIIEALYFQLVKNIDENFISEIQPKNSLNALFSISNSIMKSFYEYRFIFLDFVQVMRENDKIKAHYLQLMKEREGQFMKLIDLLIEGGFIRLEMIKNEYLNLYKRVQVVGDFWISSAITASNYVTEETILGYTEIMNQTIFPYLTEKGRQEYELFVFD